jgi:PPP family 3-phenylpropionic acid transporter
MIKISEANRLRLLYFLVFSCTASWLPIFADSLKERGFSGIEISIILSTTPLAMFVIQPFYGMMADRLGYKKCMLISSSFAAFGFLLFMWQGSFLWVLLVTIFMSVFYNGLQPILDSLTLQLTGRDPSFSYGTVRIAGAVGWALTGIVVGYYIDAIHIQVIFIFSAASLFLVFLLCFTLSPDVKNPRQEMEQSFRHLGKVLTNRTLIFILLSVFLISATVTTIWNFYSIYMKENGASATLVGFGISFQGLCEIPLFYFSSRIIAVLNLKNTLILTVFASALRMLLYSVVKDPVLAISIEILHGLSWSLFWVVCVVYVNQLVKPEWRATGQSLLYAAYFGIGAITGNFWTGYLYDQHLTIASIFFVNAGIVTVIGIAMAIILKKPDMVKAGV